VISERLGHASVAFTLQISSHVIPGMDKDAAATVAGLLLTSTQKGPGTMVPGPSRSPRETQMPTACSSLATTSWSSARKVPPVSSATLAKKPRISSGPWKWETRTPQRPCASSVVR
jgi:hypothetical protein